MSKLTKEEVLKICKADFKDADTYRKTWDIKIKEWRNAYNAMPYGNEVVNKSSIVSRDIRRQSEWLIPTLVDPFVSQPNIVTVDPVGISDRTYAQQQEVLLNTQFCRQFDRFNFVSKAVRILDRDGTVVIMTGWDYQEESITTKEYKVQTEDGSLLPIERYIALIEEAKNVVDRQESQTSIDMFLARQALEEQYQATMQQAQQLFMQLQAAQQQMMQAQQQGAPTDQLAQMQEEFMPLQQQAEEMQAQLQELTQQLQQPIVADTSFSIPRVVSLLEEEYEEVVVIKNQPTAVICRNEDIFIDPTCQGDVNKAQFFIYRYESDLSTLRQSGKYKNLEKIEKVNTTDGLNQPTPTDDNGYISPDITSFSFTDAARQKVLVHEYWGNMDINGDGIAEPIVCAWVGDTIIRSSKNPYPDKKPPFLICRFMEQPFHLYGESNGELIQDLQKLNTSVMRGIIDQITKGTDSQIGFKKGALSPKDKLDFARGDYFEFQADNPQEAFWQGDYPNINPSIWQTAREIYSQIEALTGIQSFGQGVNVAGSATAARGMMDATSNRRLYLVRNISENLIKPLLRKWLEYDKEFLDDVTVLRYTDNSAISIQRDKLSTSYSLDIQVNTFEDNQMKSQQLAFLLQTYRGPECDPQIAKMLMAEIARLNRMYDFADQIMKYEPQPDPMQQQAQQLEIEKLQAEVEKLRSEANKNMSAAAENEVDGQVKQAKAQLSLAQAKKVQSEADLADQEFLRNEQMPPVQENPNLKAELEMAKTQDSLSKRKNENFKNQLELGKLKLETEKFDFEKQKGLVDVVDKERELDIKDKEAEARIKQANKPAPKAKAK